MPLLWLLLLIVATVHAAEPAKEVTYGRGARGETVPMFDRGYLLFTIRPSTVDVWGPDGYRRFTATIENPAGASISSVAADSDGSVAVGLAFRGPESVEGGLVYFDPSGNQMRFVATQRYIPSNVAFDGRHSLWTFGWNRNLAGVEENNSYPMFRKYAANGQEAGEFGPRSLLPLGGLVPGSTALGMMRLRVTDDRVGALAYSGKDSDTKWWLELGLDGHLIGKWALGPERYGGLAYTGDARLYRTIPGKTIRLELFDRAASAWKNVDDKPVPGLLLGSEGEDLVFSRDDGVIHLIRGKIR